MIDRDTVIALAGKHAICTSSQHKEFLHDELIAFVNELLTHATQTRRETEAMAECMDMVRQDLITAGVVDKSVPPMMLAEAVIAAQHRAVSAEREACAQVGMLEAMNGIEVSAAIRARGTGGEG